MRTWIIGSGGDCDLVVAQPTVSGRHCRLTEVSDVYLVEDLNSSNGTYVNGERIASATRVSPSDAITLGRTTPMPWPEISSAPGATVIRIGRKADNDVVLDDVRVSGYHARLIVTGGRTLIEDLGSSNGTFVNSADQAVTQSLPLSASDVVYFGSLAIPALQLLSSPPVSEEATAPPVLPPAPASVHSSTPPVSDRRWAILLLAQAPILAILIVLISGQQASATLSEANWAPVAQAIASTTFAMAVASVWLGGSLAVWDSMVGGKGSAGARILAPPAARLATLLALCIAQCAVLLSIVYWESGLKGDWLAMLAMLVMASASGLLLGLVAFSLIRTPAITVGVLLLAFLPMVALGGWIRPLPTLFHPIAAMMPARRAFEGLLVLESDRRTPPMADAGSEPIRVVDLAEGFFPAESERMGPVADATALGCLLIGLTAASVFISGRPQPSP